MRLSHHEEADQVRLAVVVVTLRTDSTHAALKLDEGGLQALVQRASVSFNEAVKPTSGDLPVRCASPTAAPRAIR